MLLSGTPDLRLCSTTNLSVDFIDCGKPLLLFGPSKAAREIPGGEEGHRAAHTSYGAATAAGHLYGPEQGVL